MTQRRSILQSATYSSLIILLLLLNITTQWHWLLLFVVTVFVDAHFKTLTTVFSLFFLMDCYHIYIYIFMSLHPLSDILFSSCKKEMPNYVAVNQTMNSEIKILISKAKWHFCNRYPCFMLQLHYADTRVWENWGCINKFQVDFFLKFGVLVFIM